MSEYSNRWTADDIARIVAKNVKAKKPDSVIDWRRTIEHDIHFTIDTRPVPQARHRDSANGGKYDPKSRDKKDFLFQCMQYKPNKPIDYGVIVSLSFNYKRPKSHFGTGKNSKLMKESAPELHIQKPDIDNLIKFVFDALTPTFFKDDTVISTVTARKVWSDSDSVSINITRQ